MFSPDLYSRTRDEHKNSTDLMSTHYGIGHGDLSRRVFNVGGDLYASHVAPPERKPVYSPMSPEYEIMRGNLIDPAFGMMPENLYSKLEQFAKTPGSVKMLLKLQLDYTQTIGGGSDVREQFEANVKTDLAAASNLAPGCFRIKSVSPGMKMASVIVDMEVLLDPCVSIPMSTAVNILARQANDSQSILRRGKVTHAVSAVHAVDLDGNTLVKLILPYRTMAPQLLVEASPSKAKGLVSAEVGVANEERRDFSLLGGGGGHVARATRAAPPEAETIDDYVNIPDTTIPKSETNVDAFEESGYDDMVQIQRQSRRVQRSAAPPPAPAPVDSAVAPAPLPLPETYGDIGDVVQIRLDSKHAQRAAAPLPFSVVSNAANSDLFEKELPLGPHGKAGVENEHLQNSMDDTQFNWNSKDDAWAGAKVSHGDIAKEMNSPSGPLLTELPTPILAPVALNLEFEPEYLTDFHINDVASMLQMQLASAVSLPASMFKVSKMDTNSVDVSIHANSSGEGPDPYAVAVRLDLQSREENSALRQGAISGYIRRVTILKDPLAVMNTALAVNATSSSQQQIGMAPILQKTAVILPKNDGLLKVGTKDAEDSSTSAKNSMLEYFSESVKYPEPSADATALFSSSAAFLHYSQLSPSAVRGIPSKTDDLKTSEAPFPSKFPAGYRLDPTKIDRLTLEDRGQARPMKDSVETHDLSSKLNSTESDVQHIYRIEDREYVGREYRAGPRLPPASGRVTLEVQLSVCPSVRLSVCPSSIHTLH